MPTHLLFLALIAASSQADASDARFGPPQAMRCLWFSNFENSRFERCAVGGRSMIAGEASAAFAPGVASKFDREVRKLAGGSVDGAPWRTFEVEIIGRQGLTRRQRSRYLGDALHDVKVDRLVAMRLIRDRD